MEITLTVHVPRRRPQPVDVVVEWSGRSTAAELCAALSTHLGEPVPGLTSRGRVVDDDSLVGMPPLLHGASVAVTSAAAHTDGGPAPPTAGSTGLLDLVVVGGPDAGRSHPLVPPGLRLGRAVDDGLVVADESLSRCHLFVGVGPSGVSVEDCGSTNGVAVDGARVHGCTAVDARSTVVVGSTTLRVRRTGGPGPPVTLPGDGTVRITPCAGPPASADDVEVLSPEAPPERHRARIPWLAALVPVPVAVALAFLLGPQLLLFAVLGPLTLLGGAVGDRWGSGRARRRDLVHHAAAVSRARTRLSEALSGERERLDRAHPDPATVLATAEQHRAGLWRGGGAPLVRLGLGDVPTRVVWVDGNTRARPTAAHAPFVVDLRVMPCVGVVGPASRTDGVLANLVGQLCTTMSPDELTVSVVSSDPGWAWTRRLPHVAEPPGAARHFGSTGPARVLGLVVIPEPGPDTAALVRRAREAGVLVLTAASSRAGLPSGCDAVVVEDAGAHVLEGATTNQRFVLDRVGPWWSDRLSRALAPLRCSEQVGGARMPSRLALADALDGVQVTDAWVAERWCTGRGAAGAGQGPDPMAVVGRTPDGTFVIDLVRDGPHVLVGGTTGSGKSEFLRTLVTSLALSSPPDDLAFVLVDFKGGAAFGPCTALPHVLGLVTDLDDHLVARALASLRAELRRREHLFAEVGAGDLEGYQRRRRPDSESIPRLVVVVDELRALVEEFPDFVSGLVRLAALGRSLGVHLVLATQRPSGAVNAEIQANVSLRIAFRMRDRADSLDVLDDDAAAGISPNTPGRALARGGDGVLVSFQAATTSAPPARSSSAIRVRPAPAGEELLDHGPVGEEETSRLVEAVRRAHRLTGGRRPAAPWLAPLPDLVPPDGNGEGSRAAHGVPVAGLVDEPDLQRVSPLTWRAADGSWLLSGPSGSGRTTALRAVVQAAAAVLEPTALHIHVIDARGALADLGGLPHVGTRARPDDPRACAALVRHLRAEVDRRLEAPVPEPPMGEGPASTPPSAPYGAPVTLVVVDGWDYLVEAQPAHAPGDVPDELLRVLRDGRAVGVVGVVSGGRGLLHPRWGAVGGRTFLLGTIDPLDAALAGLRATDLPRDPPPGRAVRVHDRREVQFVAATPPDTVLLATRSRPRPAVGGAWQLRPLPAVIRRHDVAAHPVDQPVDDDPNGVSRPHAILIGVGGPAGTPWHWRPGDDGRRLLVAGPPGSGRTNVLRVVAESLCATGRFVAVVHGGSSADGTQSWPEGVLVTGAEHPDPLIRVRRDHPDLVLLVDDADRLGDAPAVPALREIIGLVDRDDGLVVAATSSTDVVTRFRGVDVELARHRAGLLLSPLATDREVLGAAVPDGIPRLPGRGVFVSRGVTTEVQVLLAEGSAGRVAPGQYLGVGLLGREGREAGEQGHPDDDPAHQRLVALDQPEADRQEQHVPDEGGGARPGGPPEPSTGQGAQTGPSEQDQQGRHQHPSGVAALTQDELDDVVHGEPGEGQRLQPGEQRGETAGAA